MRKQILEFLLKNCEWYEFWNPNSGIIGGMIFGLVIMMPLIYFLD